MANNASRRNGGLSIDNRYRNRYNFTYSSMDCARQTLIVAITLYYHL